MINTYESRGELVTLLDAWVRGWAVARATPAPVPTLGGWRIDVGLPAHRLRYVLHDPDERLLTRLGEQQNAPGTWIKIAGEPARLRTALPAEWELAETGHLMTTTYRSVREAAPPPAYTLRLATDGGVVTAVALDCRGQVAASGRLAVVGAFGIIDQVETVPAHRRRGLGSVVMHALAADALRRGADTGVLVATDDGRGLYQRLGWTVRTPIAAAHTRLE